MIRLVHFAASFAILAIVFSTGGVAGAQQNEDVPASWQTETFVVENMTCGLCPITVRKAMEGVAGVESVTVDFEEKTATVVFDATATETAAIAKASRDAGYPAHPGGG